MEMSNKWNMFEKLCDLQILSDRSCANALSDPTGISTLTLWSLQWYVCRHLSWGREGWAGEGEQPRAFSELYLAHSLAVSKCILFATWSVPWWGAFKYSCVYIHVYSQKKQVTRYCSSISHEWRPMIPRGSGEVNTLPFKRRLRNKSSWNWILTLVMVMIMMQVHWESINGVPLCACILVLVNLFPFSLLRFIFSEQTDDQAL